MIVNLQIIVFVTIVLINIKEVCVFLLKKRISYFRSKRCFLLLNALQDRLDAIRIVAGPLLQVVVLALQLQVLDEDWLSLVHPHPPHPVERPRKGRKGRKVFLYRSNHRILFSGRSLVLLFRFIMMDDMRGGHTAGCGRPTRSRGRTTGSSPTRGITNNAQLSA